MSDQAFRDFIATYVVLEEQHPRLRGPAAEKFIADAFVGFDRVSRGRYLPGVYVYAVAPVAVVPRLLLGLLRRLSLACRE